MPHGWGVEFKMPAEYMILLLFVGFTALPVLLFVFVFNGKPTSFNEEVEKTPQFKAMMRQIEFDPTGGKDINGKPKLPKG